jgi:hypothetical protein
MTVGETAPFSEIIWAEFRCVCPAARSGRIMCRLNIDFAAEWQEKYYAVKQVAPIIVEQGDETVVVTVYTFCF